MSNSETLKKLNYLKLCERVGYDFKTFLYDKYVNEKLSTRQISTLVYGSDMSSPSILRYLKRYEIPLRRGSEAVKLQWVNNDERREQQSKFAKTHLATEEVRNKMCETMRSDRIRNYFSELRKGDKNPMYGKTGELNHNFNPNISDEEREIKRHTLEDKAFRLSVFERDNFTCQCCGDDKGGNLNAHHILSHHSHKELRYDVDNGITLCKECHVKFHNEYGYKNNNGEQLNEFLSKYRGGGN